MKKIMLFLVLSIAITAFLTSCEKERNDKDAVKNITLNVTVDAGSTYDLDLSAYGDADDIASIIKQAVTYAKSEINLTGGKYIYSFMKSGTPKAGGNGMETVILKLSEPACRRHHKEETNITINFTIN
jgi:hypothetical protein